MAFVIRSTVMLTVGLCGVPLVGACGGEGGASGSGGEGSMRASGGVSSVHTGSSGGAGAADGGDGGGGASAGGAPGGTGGSLVSGGAGGTGGSGTGGDGGDGCPESGSITYHLNSPESWPSDVVTRITEAMDEAVATYNCYASLEKHITVNYNPGVPTAEANVDGWLSFGSNQAYMQTATAMHEVAHTLGVGYFPWAELMENGRWVGPAVVEFMENLPAEERDADSYSQRTYITGDAQHFWPYGLNQAAEHQSEWSLIDHVRIVARMQLDKQAFLDGELD